MKESHFVQRPVKVSVDGYHESVLLITCDKNVQKRNCIALFKFINIKFNIAMTAV